MRLIERARLSSRRCGRRVFDNARPAGTYITGDLSEANTPGACAPESSGASIKSSAVLPRRLAFHQVKSHLDLAHGAGVLAHEAQQHLGRLDAGRFVMVVDGCEGRIDNLR